MALISVGTSPERNRGKSHSGCSERAACRDSLPLEGRKASGLGLFDGGEGVARHVDRLLVPSAPPVWPSAAPSPLRHHVDPEIPGNQRAPARISPPRFEPTPRAPSRLGVPSLCRDSVPNHATSRHEVGRGGTSFDMTFARFASKVATRLVFSESHRQSSIPAPPGGEGPTRPTLGMASPTQHFRDFA
jgi:hypothetical protein